MYSLWNTILNKVDTKIWNYHPQHSQWHTCYIKVNVQSVGYIYRTYQLNDVCHATEISYNKEWLTINLINALIEIYGFLVIVEWNCWLMCRGQNMQFLYTEILNWFCLPRNNGTKFRTSLRIRWQDDNEWSLREGRAVMYLMPSLFVK